MITRGRPKERVCQLLGITPRQLRYILENKEEVKTYKVPPAKVEVPKEIVQRVKNLAQFGDISVREIAEDLGVHPNLVRQALRVKA